MAKAAPVVGARGRRLLLLAAAVVVGLGVLLVLVSAAEHLKYSGSILPGVRIDGAHVSGKGDDFARASIDALSAQLETTAIRAHAGHQTFVVEPNVIGFTVDRDATIREAREAGRSSNPFLMVADTVLRRVRPDVVHLVVHYDQTRFEGLLDGWATAVRSGLVEGDLRFRGTTVIPVAPRAGRGLLRAEAERTVQETLTSGTRKDVQLPIGDVTPTVGRAAVDAAAARARTVLTGTYTVIAGTTRVTLTPAQVAPTLGTRTVGHALAVTVDPDKLRFVLGPAFTAVEVAPVDATFDYSNPNALTVVPSRDGHQLDTAAVAAAILRGSRSITAPIRNEHPAHDTKWARALGITHQVSSFTTFHAPGQPRVHNIHLAADVLNNTVVEPGQTFSLNDKLGPRTAAKGYVKAPIILEDGFGEDYGGGISQLTTTLYNAVFFGGYVDVSHSPHHYYISRYPLGREATIVYPYVDLKFKNDTRHGVLIHAYYSDTSITVTFFGNTDGRVATEANRQTTHTEPITDRLVPCPAKKPTDDPNNHCAKLTALERETAATGETGYDVEFDRVLTQPGRPTIIQHYRAHYPMLQNTVLVGTTPATTTTTKPKTPVTKPKTTTTAAHP
ncbi:MAG TPA: VanW family protein [Acidimicrobiia bacterium]|nr:VanW family protein [Acidimicrobiia bacterium]